MGITSFTLIGSEVPDRAILDRGYTVARGSEGVNQPLSGASTNALQRVGRKSGLLRVPGSSSLVRAAGARLRLGVRQGSEALPGLS